MRNVSKIAQIIYGLRREVNFHDREREAATKRTSLRPVSFTFSLLSLFSYACSSFCKQVAHFISMYLKPMRVPRIFPGAANVCRTHWQVVISKERRWPLRCYSQRLSRLSRTRSPYVNGNYRVQARSWKDQLVMPWGERYVYVRVRYVRTYVYVILRLPRLID